MGMNWEPLGAGVFGREADLPGADPMWIWADATNYRDLGFRDGPPSQVWIVSESSEGIASRLVGRGDRAGLDMAELAMPVIPERMPPPTAVMSDAASGTLEPGAADRVLVGIIDSGCPFASPVLRDGFGGTRVLALWDQDDSTDFSRPEGIGYGRVMGRQALNGFMDQATSNGHVDEALCYALAGCSSLKRRESHGAAVVGQLFGRSLYGGSLQRRPGQPPSWDRLREAGKLPIDGADLVFVDIPRAGLQDASSAALARYVADGLQFILRHAHEGQRVVVNISTGTSRTAHDGDSLIERALRHAVRAADQRKVELHIVLPAGNGNTEQRHARLSHAGRALTLFIPPGCESPQYVTVRWPVGQTGVGLRVTPPGATAQEVMAGQAFGLVGAQGACAGVVSPQPGDGKAARSLLAFGPTASFDTSAPVAPSGNWRIELAMAPDAKVLEPVCFWVSRNQRNPGALLRGRQADFVDIGREHNPQAWLRPTEDDVKAVIDGISRAGAGTGLATAATGLEKGIWVVGSVFADTPDKPSPYSAEGPDDGKLPLRSAPGDASRAMRGLSMRGRLGGEVLRMVGTSFAAPLFARALVNGVAGKESPPAKSRRRLGAKLIRPD
jgi:hypothetical protein